MVVEKIIVLFLLITQALSAPSYLEQHRTQTLGNILDRDDISQIASQLQGSEYSRPGTWTERNSYNVDNGHGKVHEEKGQYVEGPKTVRYYKKNYTSFSTRYPNGGEISDLAYQNNRYSMHIPNTEESFNSQNAYNQVSNSKLTAEQRNYNRLQSQQHTKSLFEETSSQNERLQDLGKYSGNSQVIQQGKSQGDWNTQISQEPYNTDGNWRTVDSYKTDGGRGRVFSEEGQYVSGGKKVRYYKRNYTSNYSSSDGVPIPDVLKPGVIDLQRELENLHRNIESTNIAQTHHNTHDLVADSLHNAYSNSYGSQINYGSTSSGTRHKEGQQYLDMTNEHLPYRNPTPSTYGAKSYNVYEKHEGHVVKHQPTHQVINPTPGYTNILGTEHSAYKKNTVSGSTLQQQDNNFQQSGILDTYQSRHNQNQMSLDNLDTSAHRLNGALHSSTPGQLTHYKQHWSSSRTQETSVPHYSTDASQMNQQNLQYNNNQYGNVHNTHHELQESYAHHGMTTGQETHLGKLVTGAIDLGMGDTVDCSLDSQQTYDNLQHQRKYKRSANYNKRDTEYQRASEHFKNDFTQQTDQFDKLIPQTFQLWKPNNVDQQLQVLKEQMAALDYITQLATGKLIYGEELQNPYWKWNNGHQQLEDLSQQTDGFEDLTQQTSGKLQFGQESQQTYQPRKPNSATQVSDDLTQQTGGHDDLIQQTGKLEFSPESQQTDGFDDLTQQTTGKLEFGQETQQTYQPRKPHSANQASDDLTQQTDGFDDLTQQTSGKLEFGQESQQTYQPRKPHSANQASDDLTQQTDGFDDLTQQTSGKLEFGQESQQTYQPRKPNSANQASDDLTQQTDGFDDLTQQTSGKLEFGQETQQTYQPRKPHSANQASDDLTQQTDGFDDLTQQTSGKLEFGQQSYQPGKPHGASQVSDDLTQQTDGFDDLSQQTSGKLEFGQETQQTYQPRKPNSASQVSDDLTQQTDGFDDLTQQTSGKLEFGQETQPTYQPRKPNSANQASDDLTQQTDGFDDLTQQTSGKLEFGQETQQTYQPRKPHSANQASDDLTQQTDGFDDLTQQTSGKLEFGQETQQTYQPRKPNSASQVSDDLTQQTDGFDDLTQQTSGKLEFGQETQQTYQSRKPHSANQASDDLTQQTDGFDDLTQQTSGKLEFGQQSQQTYRPRKPNSASQVSDDLTQQTDGFDDLTQQTSGKLEFGQETQQAYQPGKPHSASQVTDDLTQQTDGFDDLTQQTSGKLEFGQDSQQSYQPWRPDIANQASDDLTQQTTGKLELNKESQQSYQPRKPNSASQVSDDLTQQTDGFDDLTQQTSGKLEFGQETQQTYQPGKPHSANHMSDDLTQQTDGFDDLTQQTSGKLEFGQQSYQPGKPHGASQVSDDFTQQTDGFDDLTQQTSGKLEFGQESQQTYQPWKPHSANQKLDDFTQQTDGFDDLTQQTSGKFELGQQTQQSYQPWKPSSNHESQDFTQQTGGFDDFAQQSSGKLEFGQESQQSYQPWKPNLSQGPSDTSLQGPVSRVPMPAGKPKPRKPNSSLRPADASHVYEVPPVIDIDADTVTKRSETRRGDQNVESTTSEYYPAKFNPQTVGSGYDVEGGNLDPVNLLHKSNDATVGLQWHYTYHPSDYRHFVQQTDQKDKEELPRSTQRNLNEGTPNEYTVIDLHQQSPNYVVTPGVKSGKRKFSHIQKQNKLISDQQISDVGTGVAEPKLEPRILQVYGGGQYNPNHNDDIYSGVTVNPSATFAPNSNMDLWDIREKLDRVTVTTTTTTTSTTTESTPPLPVEPIDVSDNIDNSQPTPFWSRVGHKVTTTFDKAKEKFKNIFG